MARLKQWLFEFVASFKPLSFLHSRAVVRAAYAVAAVLFLWACARFYLPGKGFTAFVMFGEVESPRYIPELKAANAYVMAESSGYDAQWYAQLAMNPDLGDPAMADALDGLAYRARRILLSWTAYALGGGDPVRALHVFAVQNVVCWAALAALLLRWFPATGWNNFLRWAGVLFSHGMVFSVRGALVDGPSVLLIAIAMLLIEKGRGWSGAAVLGVAGLARETNVLAAGAVAGPRPGETGGWRRVAARLALVGLPLLAWLGAIEAWVGGSASAGAENFALPFAAYLKKWHDALALWGGPTARYVLPGTLLVLVSLTVQWAFLVARPQWRNPWWRVGAAYAVLMVFLGDAVWEGHPGAAARVLLPMALAFNVLVPRPGRWWIVLLLGNLSFLLAPEVMQPPLRREELRGPPGLRFTAEGHRAVVPDFGASWYGPEGSGAEGWRWSRGPGTLTLRNAQPYPLRVDVSFAWWTISDREVALFAGERELWRGQLPVRERVPVTLRDVVLAPGETVWRFETDAPPVQPGGGDPRELAFSVRNFAVEIRAAVR